MRNVTSLSVQARELEVEGLAGEELKEAARDFVDTEIKRLNDQLDALMNRAQELEEINFDDPRLAKRLGLERESLTVDRLHNLWLEVTLPDRERDVRERALRERAHGKSQCLRYFTITNARGYTMHILADDAAVARYLAESIGRITTRQHGNLRAYDTLSIEKLPYGQAVEAALSHGVPGFIEIMGTKVVHCSEKEVFG